MPAETYTANTDPKKADVQVVISQFKGMAPSQDPHDLDPGYAAIQVNCLSLYPGELRARPGMKQIQFS